MLIVFFFLTGHTAAFAERIQVFSRIKAEACQISQGSHISALELCTVGLGAVFHYEQSVTVGNLTDTCVIKGLSIEMYPDDPLRLIRNLRFQHRRIDLPGIRCAIRKYRCCTGVADAPRCRNVGIGRYDDLISRTHTQG